MNVEIERKFLVLTDDYKTQSYKKSYICQGYLSSESGKTVRVRLKEDKGYLTIKGPSSNNGLSRFEWEKEISAEDAKSLLELCGTSVIEKYRYEVKSGQHVIEVDEFLGENAGLIVAEIELNSENETYIRPDWLGGEVTGDKRYYNSQLIKNPFCKW